MDPKDLGAGALAGLIAAGVTHPMDTLKARKITGYDVGSMKGLYRGFGTVALFCTIGNGIYFSSYEMAKAKLEARGFGALSAPFLGGLIANTLTLTVWVPQDVIKERQQVFDTPAYRGMVASARTVLKEHGVMGLYKGAAWSFLMYTPLCALYFMFYEQYKTMLCQAKACSEEDLGAHHFALGGALCGGLAAYITTPLDVLKITQQVGGAADGASAANQNSFAALVRHGRPFRGWGFRVMSIAPNYALTIALWEECRRLF